jgi:hypothetical protein
VNLLLGGLITLAVTALVQVIVIPRVQQRNRRIERWEDDLIELANIINEEMPPAYWRASGAVVRFYDARCVDPGNRDDIELRRASEALDREAKKVWELTMRTHRLLRRVRLVRRDSPYWDLLSKALHSMTAELAQALSSQHGLDRESMDEALLRNEQSYGAAIKHARDTLDMVAVSMRPPSSRVQWNARRRASELRLSRTLEKQSS